MIAFCGTKFRSAARFYCIQHNELARVRNARKSPLRDFLEINFDKYIRNSRTSADRRRFLSPAAYYCRIFLQRLLSSDSFRVGSIPWSRDPTAFLDKQQLSLPKVPRCRIARPRATVRLLRMLPAHAAVAFIHLAWQSFFSLFLSKGASRILWVSACALAEDLPFTLFWLILLRLSKHTLLILDISNGTFDLNTSVFSRQCYTCVFFFLRGSA